LSNLKYQFIIEGNSENNFIPNTKKSLPMQQKL
jgi:hypothetical protein